eukprot:3639673-Amphidinium_carterae.1
MLSIELVCFRVHVTERYISLHALVIVREQASDVATIPQTSAHLQCRGKTVAYPSPAPLILASRQECGRDQKNRFYLVAAFSKNLHPSESRARAKLCRHNVLFSWAL